jgi:murein L,D-transpeptidase YcbB/YkuD
LRILIVVFSVAMFASRGIGAQDPSTAKTSPSSSTHHKATKGKSSAKKQVPAKAGAATAKSGAAHPKTAPAASQSRSAASSQTAHRRASSKTTKGTQTARRSSQQQPTQERYKEIQQALADKGYFNGPVDGNWGPESVDALKRFQREQNLTDDGKIGSLSLIALGLGPKRSIAESTPEKVPQERVQR